MSRLARIKLIESSRAILTICFLALSAAYPAEKEDDVSDVMLKGSTLSEEEVFLDDRGLILDAGLRTRCFSNTTRPLDGPSVPNFESLYENPEEISQLGERLGSDVTVTQLNRSLYVVGISDRLGCNDSEAERRSIFARGLLTEFFLQESDDRLVVQPSESVTWQYLGTKPAGRQLTRLHFQQIAIGVPIIGYSASITFNGNGTVESIETNPLGFKEYREIHEISQEGAPISLESARIAAAKYVESVLGRSAVFEDYHDSEEYFVKWKGQFRRIWEVYLSADGGIDEVNRDIDTQYRVLVDSLSHEVVSVSLIDNQFSGVLLCREYEEGRASFESGQCPVNVWGSRTAFSHVHNVIHRCNGQCTDRDGCRLFRDDWIEYLTDPIRPVCRRMKVPVGAYMGNNELPFRTTTNGGQPDYSTGDAYSGDDGTIVRVASDAYFWLSEIREFWASRGHCLREGRSNSECREIKIVVTNETAKTASFNPIKKRFEFGGKPVLTGVPASSDPVIVAHEFAHALLRELSSDVRRNELCHGTIGEEWGALEESLADTIGLLSALSLDNAGPDRLGHPSRNDRYKIGRDGGQSSIPNPRDMRIRVNYGDRNNGTCDGPDGRQILYENSQIVSYVAYKIIDGAITTFRAQGKPEADAVGWLIDLYEKTIQSLKCNDEQCHGISDLAQLMDIHSREELISKSGLWEVVNNAWCEVLETENCQRG